MNAASSQELDALKAQLATISAQLGTLGAQLEKAEREREEYRKLYALLREENQRLKHGLLGQKAERLPKNDEQLSLAMLGLMLNSAPRAPTESAPEAAAPSPKLQNSAWPNTSASSRNASRCQNTWLAYALRSCQRACSKIPTHTK